MAELKNYDIAGAAQQGYAFGNQLRQQREGEQRRNALADLAGQAYGAAPEQRQGLIQQAVATDPQAGLALDQGLAGADDRRNRTMVNMARMLTSAPEQARNGLYQRMRPSLEQFGLTNLPPQYDPTVDQAAQSIVQAYGGAGGGVGVQSTYVDGEGNRVAIMRDGSTQILGKNDAGATQQTISINGPDGRPAQYTFDRRTGNYVPAGQSMGGQQQPAASGAPVLAQGQGRQAIDQIAASANQMIAAGIPEAQVEQWAAAQMGGGTVSDGAPSAGNQFQTSQQVVTGPSQFVGRRPEDEAAAIAAARRGVDNSMPALPSGYRYTASGGMEAIPGGPADPNVIASGATARRPPSPAEKRDAATRKTKYAQAQNVDRGLDRIDQALRGLSGGIMDTGPIDQYAQRFTKAGQEMEAAVGGMQNSLLALTRVPGIGSQSDLEARIAMLQYPSLDKAPEVNARTLANLRLFVQDLKAAYDTAVAEDEDLLTAPASPPREAGNNIDALLDMYR